jgi:cysteine desulfurase/selenocysteine lyase
VKVVAVTGASNVTGYINPVHLIAEKAHAAGAQILVDAAQLAPHRTIDMRADDEPDHLDYVALSAHKMYAPFGTGALVGPSATFLEGDPDLVGGGTVDIVTVDDVKWAGLPDKEEAGSPNVIGAVALAKTIRSLQQIGMSALAEHEAHLTALLLSRLGGIDGARLYGMTDPHRAGERVGVVPFNVDGMSHYLLAAILSAEGGIGVRNGCFCAHPYMLHLLDVSPEQAAAYQQEIRQGTKVHLPGLARVSFGCYNTEAEIDWFVEVLEKIVQRQHRGHYVQDPGSGTYQAVGFSPDIERYFSLY